MEGLIIVLVLIAGYLIFRAATRKSRRQGLVQSSGDSFADVSASGDTGSDGCGDAGGGDGGCGGDGGGGGE